MTHLIKGSYLKYTKKERKSLFKLSSKKITQLKIGLKTVTDISPKKLSMWQVSIGKHLHLICQKENASYNKIALHTYQNG